MVSGLAELLGQRNSFVGKMPGLLLVPRFDCLPVTYLKGQVIPTIDTVPAGFISGDGRADSYRSVVPQGGRAESRKFCGLFDAVGGLLCFHL